MGAIPLLLAVGALPALAQTLPASCGAAGASSYTPPAVTIPAVVLNRGTVITVTNATMLINGDTSSVAALVANPGISPGSGHRHEQRPRHMEHRNIQFAPRRRAPPSSSIPEDKVDCPS